MIVTEKLEDDVDALVREICETVRLDEIIAANPMLRVLGGGIATQNIRMAVSQIVLNRPKETMQFFELLHMRLGEILKEHGNPEDIY